MIRPPREKGLTITELVITLCILSIFMVLAIPGFSGIVNANRERTAAHQLMAMLATARLNALTHSMSAGLCDYQNGKCQRPWQTLTLVQTTKKRRILRHRKVLKSIAPPSNLTAVWRGFRRRNVILYTPSGALDSDNGSIYLRNAAKAHVRFEIVLSRGGRPRIHRNEPGKRQKRFLRFCNR